MTRCHCCCCCCSIVLSHRMHWARLYAALCEPWRRLAPNEHPINVICRVQFLHSVLRLTESRADQLYCTDTHTPRTDWALSIRPTRFVLFHTNVRADNRKISHVDLFYSLCFYWHLRYTCSWFSNSEKQGDIRIVCVRLCRRAAAGLVEEVFSMNIREILDGVSSCDREQLIRLWVVTQNWDFTHCMVLLKRIAELYFCLYL